MRPVWFTLPIFSRSVGLVKQSLFSYTQQLLDHLVLEGLGLACFYIPEYDSPVITTAYQSLAVGTKINAIDSATMLLEGVEFFACFYIPEYDSPVITTAYQSLAVRTKINAIDRAIMPFEGADFLAER